MCMNKYQKKKGSSPAEVGLIISGVLLVGFFSYTLFGDSIANIFQDKGKLAMFESNSGRASIPKANPNLLTNTDLSLNNQSFKTPIETYIRSAAGGGKLVETNGSAGNMKDLAYIAKEYIAQIQKTAETTNINTSGLDQALKVYNDTIDEYIQKDESIVKGANDPLLKVINDLDIAVDLKKEGDVAKGLYTELNKILDQLPESPEKSLLKTYTKDLLKMGEQLTYTIDSREQILYEELAKIVEPLSEEPSADSNTSITNNTIDTTTFMQGWDRLQLLSTTIIDKDGSIDINETDFYDRILRDYLDEKEFDLVTYAEKVSGYDTPFNVEHPNNPFALSEGKELWNGWFKFANGQEMYLGAKSASGSYNLWVTNGPVDVFEEKTMGVDFFGFEITETGIIPMGSPGNTHEGTCNTTGWGCTYDVINSGNNTIIANPDKDTNTTDVVKLKMAKEKLEEIYNDPNISQEVKDNIAKKIEVYLEGNFFEIFTGSYNNDALCGSLRGKKEKNKCVIAPKAYEKPVEVVHQLPPEKMPPDDIDPIDGDPTSDDNTKIDPNNDKHDTTDTNRNAAVVSGGNASANADSNGKANAGTSAFGSGSTNVNVNNK